MTSLYDAEHPYRQAAIDIIEEFEDKFDLDIINEPYYELEDYITNRINEAVNND